MTNNDSTQVQNKKEWPERVEPPFKKVFRIIKNISRDIERSLSGDRVSKFNREHSRSLAKRIQEMIEEIEKETECGYEIGDREVSFWLKFAMPIEDVPEELLKYRGWAIRKEELG